MDSTRSALPRVRDGPSFPRLRSPDARSAEGAGRVRAAFFHGAGQSYFLLRLLGNRHWGGEETSGTTFFFLVQKPF